RGVSQASIDQVGLAQRFVDAILKFALVEILGRFAFNRDGQLAAEVGEVGQRLPSRIQLVSIGVEAELYRAGLGRGWGAARWLRFLKTTATDGRAGASRRRLRRSRNARHRHGTGARQRDALGYDHETAVEIDLVLSDLV